MRQIETPIVTCFMTRNRPDRLIKSLDLLYESCYDPKNFEVHVVIDEDQVDLYDPVFQKYPNIMLGLVEPKKGNGLQRCFLKAFEMFKKRKGYFLYNLPDDLYAAFHHWDKHIASKINYFGDGMFCLHFGGHQETFARIPYVMEQAYTLPYDHPLSYEAFKNTEHFPEMDPDKPQCADFLLAYRYCEPFPGQSWKLIDFVQRAYEEVDHTFTHDLIIAFLLQQVNVITGSNRSIYGAPGGFRCTDDRTTDSLVRERRFDLDGLQRIAQDMADYISADPNTEAWL